MSDPMDVRAQVDRMVDLAWAAGVLDGRGVWVAIPRPVKNGVTYTMRVRMRLSLSHEPLLLAVQKVLGGNVNRHKNRLEWQVSGAQACLDLHELVRPHLRLQGRRAQAHATVCSHIVDHKPSGLDRTLHADVIAARSRLIGKAQAGGVVVSPTEPKKPARPVAEDPDESDIPF